MRTVRRSVLIVLLFSCFVSQANTVDTTKRNIYEYSNSIKVTHGGLYIPKSFPFYKPFTSGDRRFSQLIGEIDEARFFRFKTIGGSYERRVLKDFFIGVSYTEWEDIFDASGGGEIFHLPAEESFAWPRYVGQLDTRINYQMADVYLFYKYTTPNTRHSFNAGAGVSYCWGINDIVKVFWINPDPPYDAVTYLESKKAEYWGVVPYLGYDYQFWKNRIVIGPDIRARIYSGRPSVEYNINFHLGVNF